MLIDCPSCARCYQVDAAAVPEGGRAVVCSACGTRWLAGGTNDGKFAAAVQTRPPVLDPASVRKAPARAPRDAGHLIGRGAAAPRFTGMRQIALAAAGLALAMGVLGERAAIVHALPRTARLYAAIGLPVNLRNLEFTEVRTVRLGEGNAPVEVSGVIRNIAHGRTSVPRLGFDIRDAAGKTLSSWSEAAPKRILASNETVAFAAEMPLLPEGSQAVVVRFVSAADSAPQPSTLLIHKPR